MKRNSVRSYSDLWSVDVRRKKKKEEERGRRRRQELLAWRHGIHREPCVKRDKVEEKENDDQKKPKRPPRCFSSHRHAEREKVISFFILISV